MAIERGEPRVLLVQLGGGDMPVYVARDPDTGVPQIRATQGVLEVNLVFGQRDAIAIAKAKALFELAKVVVGEVRGIQGVQDTTTLVESEI